MYLTWRGKGYAVPLSAAVSTVSLMSISSATGFELTDGAIGAIAAGISAYGLWLLHKHLQRQPAMIEVENEKTGELEQLRLKHDFYWIPIKYWSFIFAILSVITAIGDVYPEYRLG